MVMCRVMRILCLSSSVLSPPDPEREGCKLRPVEETSAIHVHCSYPIVNYCDVGTCFE